MRAVIFVNGIIPDSAAVRRWVREGDDLIAADGGAPHAGALGVRLDQSLANVLLMAQQDWPATIHVVDANEIATGIHGGESMTFEATIGSTVSLLPLSAEVTGITYAGMLYPLDNATIALGSTRGVSNEVVSHPATVKIATGIALVIQTL